MAERWSQYEDEILKSNFDSMTYIELQKLLPNRTLDAIRSRAKMFNLRKLNMWTKEEEIILETLYPTIGGEVAKFISRHTRDSCVDKANRMGLSLHKKWNSDEDKILKENYPDKGSKSYKMIPNRTRNSCRQRVHVLKLSTKAENRRSSWTSEEIRILKKYYPIMGPDVCYKLPNRSHHQCRFLYFR